MTELVGAKRIAAKLSELAGLEVSTWQVYRLADSKTVPIERDRERWKIQASAEALCSWWNESRLAAKFAKRLREDALGRHGARMNAGRHAAMASVQGTGELFIAGTIGDSGLDTESFLTKLKPFDGEDIRVLINSGGGIVSDGLAIYNALRHHKGDVRVEIIGVAASMASAIAMAGDRIAMAEDGLFMIHDPWTTVGGNADDLRAAAEMLEKHGESLAGIYARRTRFNEDQVREMMRRNSGEGTWMNAEEALEMGFVDEILAPAEARLPNVPAAALAKRLTRRGGRKVKKFAEKLAALIKALVKDDTTREDVIDELAVQAEMTVDDVEKVLKGEAMPTLPQLRAFADVLNATSKDLRALAEKEGHSFEKPKKPQASRRADPAGPQARGEGGDLPDIGGAVRDVLAEERARAIEVRTMARHFQIPSDAADTIIAETATVADAHKRILAWLSDPKNRPQNRIIGPNVTVTADDRDKWLAGLEQWLLIKAGARRTVEAHIKATTGQATQLDPGQFRGMRLIDIARDSLERDGVNVRGMTPLDIAKRALAPRADSSGLGTTSDFPVLLENVLHKMLLAAYETAPDQWRQVAAVGSVQDFRAHPRLKLGSLPKLDALLESGEFRQLHFPDAEKETIQAATKGNIIGLTRQSIVNDDVDGFARLTMMLGRASARTIEIDLFALFALNAGLGPTLSDGNTLFHANHSNIDSTGGAPSVARFEACRVLMAQQQDPDGNDFLNLRPDVFVGPIGKGADARTAINAEFDFDAAQSGGSSKFMKPNVVRDLLSTVVDTPRLSGDRWYLLADPSIAPVFEVVFLEGQESPLIEAMEGFDFDGVRWRIRHDFGVGATDFRGGVTNAGS